MLGKWFKNLFVSSSITNISIKELKERLNNKKDYYFLDVRTKPEFKSDSIRGFNNFPVQNLNQNLSKIPRDKEIIVICQSGGRSMMACKMLKKSGFENVSNVVGGMNSWNK